MPRPLAALVASVALACSAAASAQTAPLAQRVVEMRTDSGELVHDGGARRVVHSELVHVEDAGWLRLRYEEARLGAAPAGGEPTVLRVTSLVDGAVQHMTAEHLRQWRHTSAFFNGNMLLVEVVADAGAAPSRIRIHSAWAGEMPLAGPRSICGPFDDRLPSSDPRGARAVPIGCSVWLIDDAERCFLTAGHCTGSDFQVMEFNVPESSSSGVIQHPGPEDQYAPDPASIQSNGGQGVGNDWAYFGCFPNTETGLTAFEAQGETYALAAVAPPVTGQDIRITGYGTTSTGVPPQWNQLQKTHTGAYTASAGTRVSYVTDTTGGNSGSPVIDETTGLAIGIHTHGGCTDVGGENNGTAVHNTGLQEALANPRGVCIPTPLLTIDFPDGLPELLDPTGDSVLVEVTEGDGGQPQPDTGLLHLEVDGAFEALPMTALGGALYRADFPPLACATTQRFYFSAQTTEGEAVASPLTAPSSAHVALVVSAIDVAFADDFETALGWTVVNEALEDGPWERGVPAGDGLRGDPTSDADGTGQCMLTDNVAGNSDVDGGPTRLVSPTMDLADLGDPLLSYWRWFTNDDLDIDRLTVELSDDGGATWALVESVPGTVGWVLVQVPVRDYIDLTPDVRVRFSAVDQPNDSVTEAAIDGVRIVDLICGTPGDVDGDGDVDVEDLLAVLGAWGPCAGCAEDLDGDGSVGVTDLLAVLAGWTG